ncbi:hypothetical protein K439DRAFT_1642073 [Ramaria rubella]|nr:hypothetical protein K439DRAFT_1642073 [Ramaria rubella]
MGMLKVVSRSVSHRLGGRSSVHQCSTSRGVDWIRKAQQSTFAEALQTFFQSLPTSVDDLGCYRPFRRLEISLTTLPSRITSSVSRHRAEEVPQIPTSCKFLRVQLIQLACHLYLYADMAHMATTAANTVLTPLGRHDSLDSLLQIGIILAADAEAGIGDNAGEE